MNQNVQTVQYFQQSNFDQQQGGGRGQTTAVPIHSGSTIEFHPTSSGTSFHPNTSGTFHTNGTTATFIPSNVQQGQHVTISQPQGASIAQPRITTTTIPVAVNQPGQPPTTVQVAVQMPPGVVPANNQHIIITTQPVSSNQANDRDDRGLTFMEYFVEPQQSGGATIVPSGYQPASILATTPTAKYTLKDKLKGVPSEREMVKRAKQAEAARLRYHRLSPEEKKALNLKRTQAQKRKRQREREMAELETILRKTNDIIDDPEVTEQLREKRMRARWAEAARSRYQRMSEEERRAHNTRRRMRQLTIKNEKGEVIKDEDAIRVKVKEQNAKKAAAARNRYHRMSLEEKKLYNQRRTEAFRRRRMEEEALLAMPIGRINGEALDRAQQIVVRNAKRAEAARLRYQKMTPDQRKAYNQKRYTPKRKRESTSMGGDVSLVKQFEAKSQTEYDALSSLERDVIKRTQQAQQVLMRQRQGQQPSQQQQFSQAVSAGNTIATIVPTDPSQGQLIQQHHQPHQTILIPQSIVSGSQQQPGHQQVHVQAVPAPSQHQIQYTSNGSIVVQNVPPQQPQIITTYTTQQPQHSSN